MHPFPVDPKQIPDPLEDTPHASVDSRRPVEAMPMRRRTRNVGRVILGLLFAALVVAVLIALL